MADVRLFVPAGRDSAGDLAAGLPRHKKCTIRSVYQSAADWSVRITCPYVEAESDLSDLARSWVTQDRAAKLPITRPGAPKLAKATLTVIVADPASNQASVEAQTVVSAVSGYAGPASVLRSLRAIADGAQPVQVSYGPWMTALPRSGLWLITDMTVKATQRAHADNAITRATVTLDLLEANIPGFAPSLVAGGLNPWNVHDVAIPNAGSGRPHSWVVSTGERLWDIARALYGAGEYWRTLADYNGIIDPARQVVPGVVLRVP